MWDLNRAAPSVGGGLRILLWELYLLAMSTGDTDVKTSTAPHVKDLLGAAVDEALARYGSAAVDRMVGEDRWVCFENSNWTLRLRARPDPEGELALVRAWTAAFARGFNTVAEALNALGIRSPAPPAGIEDFRQPLCDAAGRVHSLTVSVKHGRIRAVSGFDEPPDW